VFKAVPSASTQAMMISLSNAVIYGFMGDKFNIEKNNARLSLMTKCAIDSDATIGFNLPLIDPKKPDNGNFFVSIMNQFRSADISSKEVEDAAKSLSEEEIKKISKVYNENRPESNESEENDSESNEPNNKEKEVTADPKNIAEFAKEFGPMVMKDFRQNMSNLFDIIVEKAKKIKDNAQKKREKEAEKAQQESESKK
jgi:cytochrome c553